MLHNLFTSLEINQNKNAFFIKGIFYTYAELSQKVNSIISQIEKYGGSKNGVIGIVSYDAIESYASILACWFKGYAYVPLNPKNPAIRNDMLLKEAKADLLLEAFPPPVNSEYISFEIKRIITSEIHSESVDIKYLDQEDSEKLLYILFTSGSTGIPKGVPISIENINTFLESFESLGMELDSSDRCLQMFDLAFDVSVASYLIPLLKGACVYTVQAEGVKYLNIYKILKDQEITFASIVPSVLNHLKSYFQEILLPSLRYCILTAEASNVENVTKWAKCIPNSKIINLYGPTEATIWCTKYEFVEGKVKSYNEMLAIGKPFSMVNAFIIDEFGNQVPNNVKGELCIVSNQLSGGYLNDIAKTESVFIENSGIRYYKTGDLCYMDEELDLIYCGRIDHQVKIQGFRIELSEIEVIVHRLYNKNNVAVAYRGSNGDEQICLFIEDLDLEERVIKIDLGQKLPAYMIPTKVKFIDKLPINNSGKIDRKSLLTLV